MALKLYAHPFSSYCQKVLIALYENATPFELRMFGLPEVDAELAALWPLKKIPLLVDGDKTVMESTVIIEHLELHYPGPVKLLPDDPNTCLEVRFMDRFFDNHIMSPMQIPVAEMLKTKGARKAEAMAEARQALDTAYSWLELRLAHRTWAIGDTFTMADCAAAPSLFYADWVHPINDTFGNVRSYRQRLLARPSYARAVEEARPFRKNFPLGAPDRD